MLGRNEKLEIARRAASILRDSKSLVRVEDEGYTRVDPFKIAMDADLMVMKRRLESLLGGFVREEQPGILVNIDRPPGLIHMTCAHELGHFFLGHSTTMDQQLDYGTGADDKEREADWFAYNLLMPRGLIVDVVRRKAWSKNLKDPSTLYQLSLRLGTSFTATCWTLVYLKLLSLDRGDLEKLVHTPLQPLKRNLFHWYPEHTISDVWVLDENDRERILEPRPDDLFLLDLPSHASAGYLWSLDEAVDAGFKLKPMTITESAKPAIDEAFVVGGSRRQRYVLEPAEGHQPDKPDHRLKLAFCERQPWRKHVEDRSKFALTAEFEVLSQGIDEQSREKLLAEVADA